MVKQVISLVNVAYVLVQEAWEVEGDGVPVLGAARAQLTGAAGAPAPTEGDHLHDAVAFHQHPADAATAGHHLHIAMPVMHGMHGMPVILVMSVILVIRHMEMEMETNQGGAGA